MASLEIRHDEDIYEGKLYGWRWFLVTHGLWSVVPPMFSSKRTVQANRLRLQLTRDPHEYARLLGDWFDSIDLLGWNQSDVPPDYITEKTLVEAMSEGKGVPRGHASGFHLFANYRDAVNYANVPYTVKRSGMSLPFTGNGPPQLAEVDWLGDHLMPCGTRLQVTPLLAFVEASGAIVEHQKGYRAHLLRLVSLHTDGRKRERADLANKIGWPGEIHRYRKIWNMENPTETQLRRIECD